MKNPLYLLISWKAGGVTSDDDYADVSVHYTSD